MAKHNFYGIWRFLYGFTMPKYLKLVPFGPGRITHLWFTGWQHYRDLLIKITWDDADEPSVHCPYGDFSGSTGTRS